MRRTPIGPGAFVPVVGPSGAGKDSLLAFARTQLADHPEISFARRVITRPCDPASEAHDTLGEDAFARAQAAGAFALSWRSHGLGYGIPASVDEIVAAGGVVVANVSRGTIAEIRARYRRVAPVLVTVPNEVLAQRLAARGRESAEAIAGRLARNADYAGFDAGCETIDNGGALEEAGMLLVAILKRARHPGVIGVC